MRGWICAPMMTLCLCLAGCGGTAEETAQARDVYHDMAGCTMEAVVSCGGEEALEFTLRCDYAPGKSAGVEVLAPETAAGVTATVDGTDLSLTYGDVCLEAGTLSREEISPAACLPRMMSALRDGWLLEENREEWDGVPCLRLCVDQTGDNEGKIVTTMWLREDSGTPLRGEIAVEDEIILTAEFTSFQFYDTMADSGGE